MFGPTTADLEMKLLDFQRYYNRLAYFTPGLKRNGLDVILSELSGSVADDPPRDR